MAGTGTRLAETALCGEALVPASPPVNSGGAKLQGVCLGWLDRGSGRAEWEGHLKLRRLLEKAGLKEGIHSFSREVQAGATSGWSVSAGRSWGWERPEATLSRCCPQASCSIGRETEAQRGDALVQVAEAVRQSQGWQLGLLPCAQISFPPQGLSPSTTQYEEASFERGLPACNSSSRLRL